MAAIYPYKWSGQFANADAIAIAKNEWQEVLNKLTNEQIMKGLSICKINGSSFPPTMGEFYKLCLPTHKELGILDVDSAYTAYCKNDFSNSVVASVNKKINRYDWNMLNISDGQRMFNRIYKICIEEFLAQHETGKLLLTHGAENNGS